MASNHLPNWLRAADPNRELALVPPQIPIPQRLITDVYGDPRYVNGNQRVP